MTERAVHLMDGILPSVPVRPWVLTLPYCPPGSRGRRAKDVARGLAIRCDCGPHYVADAGLKEVRWVGSTISPSYVGSPACNGVIERFNRTLKEPRGYLHRFESLEQARAIIAAFIERYNHEWLIERLVHGTRAQARGDATRRVA